MKRNSHCHTSITVYGAALLALSPLSIQVALAQESRVTGLEEIVVTAQRREQSLQSTPIAVSAFDVEAIEAEGISSLQDFNRGASPYVRVAQWVGSSSSMNIAMRGIAPIDPSQGTREQAVGIYIDDIYLGRVQGIGSDLIDVERIEVLRGPQGTLFGRNTVGGAVRFITKQPTGEFGFEQTLSMGNYGHFKSLTRVNLPEWNGLKIKGEYLTKDFDGWIKNPAPGQEDFHRNDADGGRLTVLWDPVESFSALYNFDKSSTTWTNAYAHFKGKDFSLPENRQLHNFPVESRPVKRARFPITLEPSKTKVEGHSLTLAWDYNEHITLKSITSYRKLEEDALANYGGLFAFLPLADTFGFNLLGTASDTAFEQDQITQEFQILGTTERFNYVLGVYYFDEEVDDFRNQGLFSHGVAPTPDPFVFDIDDVFNLEPIVALGPGDRTEAEATSRAIFAQGTWTPPILNDRLEITLGVRYTEDEKSGIRNPDGSGGHTTERFDFSAYQFDPSVILNYSWTDSLSTYASWSNAYLAGGANLQSETFATYDNMEAESYEVGLKSEWWDRRIRLNAAAYQVEYEGYQIDFSTVIPSITETINAETPLKVKGMELDFTMIPLEGLTLSYTHAYTDSSLSPQYNPFVGATNRFHKLYSPRHSGAFSVNYDIGQYTFGELSAYVSYNWSDKYWSTPHPTPLDRPSPDNQVDYSLLNARLTLSEIPVGERARMKVSAWGYNLTDDKYYNWTFNVVNGEVLVGIAGQPRTYGLDVSLIY